MAAVGDPAAVDEQATLSVSELRNSPSRNEGMTEDEEFRLRLLGGELLQEGGMLLKLSHTCVACAHVLFQRFYCKRSFYEFNAMRTAAACIFLATKLEEEHRRAREVINVFHRMRRRRMNKKLTTLSIGSKQYDDIKSDIVRIERHVLIEHGFECHVDLPHKYAINFLQILQCAEELAQDVWSLLNDSLRTTLCVRYPADKLACGAIHLAAREHGIPLPETEPCWWELFGADRKILHEVACVLLASQKGYSGGAQFEMPGLPAIGDTPERTQSEEHRKELAREDDGVSKAQQKTSAQGNPNPSPHADNASREERVPERRHNHKKPVRRRGGSRSRSRSRERSRSPKGSKSRRRRSRDGSRSRSKSRGERHS